MPLEFRQPMLVFCGKKRHGKNTAAEFCMNHLRKFNIQSALYAFADEMKQEVSSAFGVSVAEMEAHKEFWRPIYQFWGTDFRRVYQKNDNYWVEILHKQLQRDIGRYNFTQFVPMITDCRYRNELDYVKQHYNVGVFWIHRPGMEDSKDTHASENSLSEKDCDAILVNSSKEELFRQIRENNQIRALLTYAGI